MTPNPEQTLSLQLRLPLLTWHGHFRFFNVIGSCRRVPAAEVDAWLVRADGTPRTDLELVAEVLLELRSPQSWHRSAEPCFDVGVAMRTQGVPSMILAAYLAALPRA